MCHLLQAEALLDRCADLQFTFSAFYVELVGLVFFFVVNQLLQHFIQVLLRHRRIHLNFVPYNIAFCVLEHYACFACKENFFYGVFVYSWGKKEFLFNFV